jgi:hypothetical protein
VTYHSKIFGLPGPISLHTSVRLIVKNDLARTEFIRSLPMGFR